MLTKLTKVDYVEVCRAAGTQVSGTVNMQTHIHIKQAQREVIFTGNTVWDEVKEETC